MAALVHFYGHVGALFNEPGNGHQRHQKDGEGHNHFQERQAATRRTLIGATDDHFPPPSQCEVTAPVSPRNRSINVRVPRERKPTSTSSRAVPSGRNTTTAWYSPSLASVVAW